MSNTTTQTAAPGQHITLQHPSKSIWAAFFLTLLFGPIGLLYASIAGGILLSVAALVLVPLTAFLAAPVIWILSIIWGITAAALSKTRKTVVTV